MFVAVGHDGIRLASADGQAWGEPQVGKEGEVFRALAFGDGRCAAVGAYGGSNILAGTTNGREWKRATIDGQYSRYFRGMCFGAGRFFAFGGDPGAVGAARPFVATSSDGTTWSKLTDIPGKYMLRRCAWGDQLFVAVGDRGRRARSKDGLTWEDVADVRPLDTLIDIAYGAGVFVGVGLHGLRMTTRDGLAWSKPERGREGEHLNSITWADDRFVAVGQGATYISRDGEAWERRANRNAPLTMCFGGGAFLGAAWKGRLLRSTDAIEWTQVYKSEHHIEAVAHGKL
jgi:hypothetical protein